MLRRFKVVIEKEIEGGYSVFLPAFPGCASQGETIEEALANIREAADLYIWSLKNDKLPLPESDLDVEVREIEVSVW
ncbi:MAG: type II toxin-antitoxin system HicB family antitoxin, partial [Candidatus Omnitrophota bacterium]